MAFSGLEQETHYSEISYTSELKISFTIYQKECGAYFSIINTMKVTAHKIQSCFIICIVEFIVYHTKCA